VVGSGVGDNGGGASKGAAADQLRRHNLAAVLNRLHLAGPVSRSELAATTGLNRSTIADLIRELAALRMVTEGPGPAAAGPGRPSPLVRTRPEGAVVLAVELTVDSVGVATVGLGGHVFNRVHVARPREDLSPEEAIHNVADLARPLLAALPSPHRFAGVGIGVAGITRRSDGFLHLAPNLGWRDVPIGRLVSTALSLEQPISAANEADLGALAEHRRGVRPGVRNLIYVSGEVGIGAGVIIDGEPLLGTAGYAGEAGHTLINPAGRRCRCGAVGCWETEAGEAALLRHAGLQTGATGLGLLEALAERAVKGDPATLAALAEVGHWLGLGIGSLINLFNPEIVVLGGLYHRFFPFLEEFLTRGARSQALAAAWENTTIVPSGLGVDAVLVGAAELALSSILADPARVGRVAPVRPRGSQPLPRTAHRGATDR
jgi:predicted NBD/HSP70 family sugar kinase